MAKKLPSKDVVVIGFGWTGSILAESLTAEGLEVLALERGPWRDTPTDTPTTYAQDELRYHIRHDLFLRPAQETFTFRNNRTQTALPMRGWGSFMPPNGVGGAGLHWNAQTWRFLPTDFVLRTHLTQRYGTSIIPEDMTIQDWGVTYDELEPYYDRFEYLCGISGTAGNLKGTIQAGGNPFEGPRSRPYPTPAMAQPFGPTLFGKAAAELGYKPFPQPSGNLSAPYTNPLGVSMAPCSYCGYCEWFGCGNYSKATPQTTVIPALLQRPNFELRTECEVARINLDSTGKKVASVTYVDTSGEEWEQPGDLFILSAFQLFNVHLLLHSGIGKPYDPVSGEGVIGRNYSYQTMSSVDAFFDDRNFNPFVSAGAVGVCLDEWNGDNFDHGPLGFVGGGYVAANQTHGRPIELVDRLPQGTPKWGAHWKKAVKGNYLSSYGMSAHGSCYSYRDVHLDLDPTYTDRLGRKLMRMTFDFHDNELKMSAYITDRLGDVVKAMGPREMQKHPRTPPYNSVPYQTTHTCGGAIMGADPKTSALNRYLQHWDAPNLFVMGASAFPQNAGYNPTGTVGALAYWAADAIRTQYLKAPGPLVRT